MRSTGWGLVASVECREAQAAAQNAGVAVVETQPLPFPLFPLISRTSQCPFALSLLALAPRHLLPKAAAMPIQTKDISKIRNKQVRSDLNQKRKKDLRQAKLKKRIARKEAEARGEHVEKGQSRLLSFTLVPLLCVWPTSAHQSRGPPLRESTHSPHLGATPDRHPAHDRKHARVARRRRRRGCRPAHTPRTRHRRRPDGRRQRRHGLPLQPLPHGPSPATDPVRVPPPRRQGPHHDEPGQAPRAVHQAVPRRLAGAPRRQEARRRRAEAQPQV